MNRVFGTLAGIGELLGDILASCFAGAQLITYVMAGIRWFSINHINFWQGFSELLWALCPVVNFTYVWDWWFAAFVYAYDVGQAFI
ncbi:MAG TPA: hypothetical protein VGX03_26325 [Candidatus Binatia bacterium]|jgi:hypothetical protein|nr:hypothetical protein [Candidatus Binatia bacterium]